MLELGGCILKSLQLSCTENPPTVFHTVIAHMHGGELACQVLFCHSSHLNEGEAVHKCPPLALFVQILASHTFNYSINAFACLYNTCV